MPSVNIINLKKMFNQGRNSLRGHHSCTGLIQDNLSLLKLQLTWKYVRFWNEISVHSRKGVGFETDIIWNSLFFTLSEIISFLIRSWRKNTRIIWFNIISSAKNGAEMQNWMEIIKKSSKMVTPLLTLFYATYYLILVIQCRAIRETHGKIIKPTTLQQVLDRQSCGLVLTNVKDAFWSFVGLAMSI